MFYPLGIDWIMEDFSIFLKEIFNAYQGCIYLIKNKSLKTIQLWNIITIPIIVLFIHAIFVI